ncbi:MAG: hypothetical protein CL613_07385 [Aquimarina sp.]|nr:hypothetical protein [Aquimarina sp.]
MSSRIRKKFSFKRNSVKTFLFFLVFTSILWLFIQFSKNYTKEIEAEIQYVNIPEDRLINETSDHTIKMTLNGNGFRLISQSWSKPVLNFDLEDAVRISDSKYLFDVDKDNEFLKRQLDFSGRVLSLRRDTITLNLDIIKLKKVKVQSRLSIKYMNGYGSDEGVKFSPDSVTVSGPEKAIDSLNHINTKILRLEDVNENLLDEVELDTDSLPVNIRIKPQKVDLALNVSKFTEGSLEIPVTLINVPDDVIINIFPKSVSTVYRVALNNFDRITAQDFRVIADYSKIIQDSPYLILEIENAPDFVHDLRLREKQVQFVILK